MRTNALPILHSSFSNEQAFRTRQTDEYSLLPIRFLPLDATRYAATNIVGEYKVLTREELYNLVNHQLPMDGTLYEDLKSKHFLIDGDSLVAVELVAAKLRTRYYQSSSLTSLFLFVVTLRCEHACPYCQVSRRSMDKAAFDMSEETAHKAIDLVFESPSHSIKVEFQGGEPLLNFARIRFIVQEVERRNVIAGKDIAFVIATNLALIDDDILTFCQAHSIDISTSLDGPADLHNANRPRPGGDSYEKTIEGIKHVREVLGDSKLAALMTTTKASLGRERDIIDEYRRQGFNAIFLRSLSPYGFAVKTGAISGYDIDAWLEFYKRGLRYILDLNRSGEVFVEEYAAIMLRKMLTPYPQGFVDLQSPAGLGLAVLAINYDGYVYASDEARMLAEMKDYTFRLGKVGEAGLADLISSDAFIEMLESTMTEGMPLCSECGFQPYCGSDPVFHHATQNDMVGNKGASSFCKKNMQIAKHLILLMEDYPEDARVLRSWL